MSILFEQLQQDICCCVCSVSQCVVACCSVLQCVVTCCSVLQCVVACCSVLQCVAVCCSVLQQMHIYNSKTSVVTGVHGVYSHECSGEGLQHLRGERVD